MQFSQYRYRYIVASILVLSTVYLLFSTTPAPLKASSSSQHQHDQSTFTYNTNNKECMVSFGKYNGHKYKSPPAGSGGETIGDGKCLVESKWMQIMQHTVQLPVTTTTTTTTTNHPKPNIIHDWLFIDYHDRINVLVEDPASTHDDDPTFLVFRQSKYALEGKESLAVIGGIIEPGEDAKTAAVRELREEMNGMVCETFVFLGRFRTDVNRGMGFVNSFLARDCEKGEDDGKVGKGARGHGHGLGLGHGHDAVDVADEVGKPDTERQDIVSMTLQDLKKNAMDGRFLEVQWSNTVALALLHIGESQSVSL